MLKLKMNFLIINLLISNLMVIFAVEQDAPIVNTTLGVIRGYFKISFKNRTYDAFTRIPYAKPPVGDYRFQAPLPISAWDGVLNATKDPNMCPQFDSRRKKAIGDEDCLFLNVFRPHVQNNSLLPVIFYIHGGAFLYGSSVAYEPKYIMDKDFIFVSTNYRLNSFGFLSTGDEVVPGNMGLKDQNLALKWTVEHIKSFGGDPKKITLWGCSAGGASVHYQYLSPLSKGLFQGGLSMSGSALTPWAFARKPMKDTRKFAEILGCYRKNTTDMIGCLRGVPTLNLTEGVNKLLMSEYLSRGIDRPPFRPVAEKIKDGYFINESPKNIIVEGKAHDVPWIAGSTTEEGIMLSFGYILNQTSLTYIDSNWNEVGPYMMFMQDEKSKERRLKSARLARKHYLKKKSLNVTDYETLKNLIHLVGDRDIVLPARKSAGFMAKANKSPVYLYQYNYRAEKGITDALLRNADVDFGVCHCDDADLILKRPMSDPPKRKDELQMQEIIMNMIYSLAVTGIPNVGVEWPRVNTTNKKVQYLHIGGPDKLIVKPAKNYGERIFWEGI